MMSEQAEPGGCLKVFGAHGFTQREVEEYARLVAAKKPYVIFFTPRSGSSYLAEVLAATKQLGQPEEFLNQDLAPLAIKHITETGHVTRHVIDYLSWIVTHRSSENGVFGLKLSYGCIEPLVRAGLDRVLLGAFTPITLVRKNILKQAVSLYVAVSTGLFHTNIAHSQEVYDKASTLVYDWEKIRFWVQHMAIQEAALGNYIEKNGLDCLHVDYDQVCREPGGVLERIAARLHVPATGHVGGGETVFQKVRTKTNDALVEQFVSDESNLRFLESLGLDESRLLGE